ncbi:hypothetical protein HU200_010402 [Digitaria exilis]|uniref:Uncharacterized protein n=1 Tax=Digitaria exilis TaxID=1010633 RepID=A0A835FHP4_9POAL|nr:hypothetical protein HU200_010402 [Digitaria exilis]
MKAEGTCSADNQLHLIMSGPCTSRWPSPQLTWGPRASSPLYTAHFQQDRRKKLIMISTKRIAQMAKKWQRMAMLGRKRLSWRMAKEADGCCTSVASKAHCVMYTSEGKRFEVPLAYLSTPVFAELLQMSQEEFGFVSDGRITLSCDYTVMEYAMCLLRRGSSAEVEKAFLSTMALYSTICRR